ncbi:MAG: GAF domain-containing protein [Chloroflexia bacterium]|nr:GAF domain-containing protein [Chloroflexia bacterium]
MNKCQHRLARFLLLALLLVVAGTFGFAPAMQAGSAVPEVRSAEEGPAPAPVDPLLGAGRYVKFGHVSLEQGLSQSNVSSILQDSRGYLWFGTEDGLNRYNGYSMRLFEHDPQEPHSLAHNDINALFEDQQGNLWVGTHGAGLDRFDPTTGEFSHYWHDPQDPHSLGHDVVETMYQDRQGRLWIGTNGGGLDRLDPETDQFTHYTYDANDPASLSNNHVYAIVQDRQGLLWIGTAGGLNWLDPENGALGRYEHDPADPNSLGHNTVVAVLEDRQGSIWVGTYGWGLAVLDRETGTFTRYQHEPDNAHSLSSDVVNTIYQDRGGTVWVGTQGSGLDRLDPASGRISHYQHSLTDPHSLSSDYVTSIYQDREGLLWIGTMGGGINTYAQRNEQFVHYRADPENTGSLRSNRVLSFYQDRRGILWIGTDQGLDRLDRSNGQIIHYESVATDLWGGQHNIVLAIHEDRWGTLWIGTAAGLKQLDPLTGQLVHYRPDPRNFSASINDYVKTILEDSSGILWIGTDQGLAALDYRDEELTYYRHSYMPQSLSHSFAFCLCEGQEGELWVGTYGGGLDKLDRQRGTFRHYQHDPQDPNSLSENKVLSLYQDGQGILWIGTLGGGLNRLDPTTGLFRHYREGDGLPNDVVHGILEDSQGFLWLSTNNGLARFDPSSGMFKSYQVEDGLQSNEFNPGACGQNVRGEMFFGGNNGFNAFFPENIEDNPVIPALVLTAFSQGGVPLELEQPLDGVGEISLHWPNNFFEFEFAALSYLQPEKNQYSYILEPLDKHWVDVGSRRFGRYSNLPGGDYTLRIRGSNNDGLWNEEGLNIKITIVPPFWATWWVRSLAVILLVGGAVAGYRLRVRGIEVRSQELEQQVRQRTYELERRRQELEALYRADEELYRHLQLDLVLQALVDTAVELLHADKGAVMIWDECRERLQVRVAHGFKAETLAQMSFAPGQGVAGRVALSGEPAIVEDTHLDPQATRSITDAEDICSFMQVPIKVGGEVFGVFSADYVRSHAFKETELQLLLSLAERTARAIENAQLYEQARELVVVEERQRLARELHDSVTQSLYGITLYAEASARMLAAGQGVMASEHLRELRDTAQEALREMRLLIYELRPPALEQEGLAAALRARLDAVEERAGLQTSLTVSLNERLPLALEEGLYRVAQEALNNALKHAQACRVEVSLSRQGGRVSLTVSDDGVGFDPTQEHGLGLPGMSERAARLGGRLILESAPGAGTTVKMEVEL